MERIVNMKRMPAKPLNEGSVYIGSQRDKRKHSEWIKKDPNDPRTMEELEALPFKERWDALTVKYYYTEAWIRGEEYPMPYKIRMPEEDDVLCPELLETFPNDAARRYHAENANV
jgi:hypothetical protein